MSWLKRLGLVSAADRLSVSDANTCAASGECLIVDIRQPSEWASTGLAPGSFAVPLDDPQFETRVADLSSRNPGKSVALMCRSGMRANSAAKRLDRHGMAALAIISGGMMAWKKAGLPVEAAPTEP